MKQIIKSLISFRLHKIIFKIYRQNKKTMATDTDSCVFFQPLFSAHNKLDGAISLLDWGSRGHETFGYRHGVVYLCIIESGNETSEKTKAENDWS